MAERGGKWERGSRERSVEGVDVDVVVVEEGGYSIPIEYEVCECRVVLDQLNAPDNGRLFVHLTGFPVPHSV